MTEKIQPSGLCINCSNADECSYRMNHTKPIIFCEEFSCTDPSGLNTGIDRPIVPVYSPVVSVSKGICSNCENLEACNLQKTGSIITNCEEYK